MDVWVLCLVVYLARQVKTRVLFVLSLHDSEMMMIQGSTFQAFYICSRSRLL